MSSWGIDEKDSIILTESKGISRRQALKWLSIMGMACSSPLPLGFARAYDRYGQGENAFHSACTVNCESSCFLKAIVKDHRIIRMESDSSADSANNRGNRACLRGRSMRQLVYTPDRIKYPMRRIKGTLRGDGRYERITWDEALDEIAERWLDILKRYGPESVYKKYGTGTIASGITNGNEWNRLANMLGGSLNEYGSYSVAQLVTAASCMFGNWDNNGLSEIANSRLVVLFGSNLLETRASGGGLSYELKSFLDKGKGA